TYVDHVNEYDLAIGNYEFNYKNSVKHKSTLNANALLENHSRDALLVIDENAQDVRLSEIIAVNDSKEMRNISKNVSNHNTLLAGSIIIGNILPAAVIGNMLPKGSLVMGTSGSEALYGHVDDLAWYINTIAVPHTDVIYGGDGDDTIRPFTGDDYIIAGNGNDTIFGDSGDDKYIYYKGQGTDTIIDTNGNDSIYLYGYTSDEIKSFAVNTKSNKDFITITDNSGIEIYKIWTIGGALTHSIDVMYYADNKMSDITRLVDWNKVQTVKKIEVACPVNVEVYNGSGELVTTLNDGSESFFANDDGVFSVAYDGQNYVKCIDICNDSYTYIISCIGDGKMCVNQRYDRDDGTTVNYTAKDITIQKGMRFTLSSTVNDMPVLSAEAQGINFIKSEYVSIKSLSANPTSLSIEVGKQSALELTIFPDNATATQTEWISGDKSIATVDQNGTITAIAPGKTFVSAEIDGKIISCNIIVKEKQLATKPIVFVAIFLCITAVVIIAFKRKNAMKKPQ
ncbi:MAG: hypothetical protein GX851_06570, partial [Clostridiales bacterium]|nr:hypothetical protein [Clostridiales bacterium]